RFQDLAHFQAVGLLVALGARRPDGGTAGGVQQAELNADGVGDFAHNAAEGVDFADQVALGDATDGRIAGHLCDEVDVQGVESSPQAHAGGGHGGLASGVSSTDDDDVELFGELHVREYTPGNPGGRCFLLASRGEGRGQAAGGRREQWLESERTPSRESADSDGDAPFPNRSSTGGGFFKKAQPPYSRLLWEGGLHE